MTQPSRGEAALAEGLRRRRRGFWTQAFFQLLRNRIAAVGAVFIFLLATAAIFAPWVAPRHYTDGNLDANYAAPSREYPLGADFLGRDVLSRIIYGTRVSLAVGVLGATMATLIGMAYGAVAGYYGGRLDNWMMRLVDLLYALPTLLVIILLMVFFRSSSVAGTEPNLVIKVMRSVDASMGGVFFIFVGVAVTSWMTMARLVRGIILSLMRQEFVDAARAIGASDRAIMARHLLPNFLGPVIVAETLNIPTYILFEAFLSFIGLGVNPPMPSWGMMIAEGIRGMRSFPHLVVFPAMALSLTLLAFNFLGDGLRDALDPRLRR